MTQIGSTVVVAVEEQKGSDEQRIHELSNATSNYRGCCSTGREKVKVDVIIPVHNAEKTIVETILHVCNQRFPISADECLYRTNNNLEYYHSFDLDVTICCHDDGSEDQSLALLYDLQEKIQQQQNVQSESNANPNPSATDKAVVCVRQLLISSSAVSWGAGFARNQAASLPHRHHRGEYLAMLDADDIMLPTRLVEQVAYLRHLTKDVRDRTLLGCHFQRDPPDSTWHYTQWANSLSDDRLLLERFREVTILQPTWMISRRRFEALGGYITTTCNSTTDGNESIIEPAVVDQNPTASPTQGSGVYHLISPLDTVSSLRLAEDLRFFYAHLAFHYNHESIQQDKSCINHYPSVYGGDGLLKLVGSSPLELPTPTPTIPTSRSVEDNYNGINGPDQAGQDLFTLSGYQSTHTIKPLLIYRHLPGCTQSARTSRKLLMQLRVKAFEDLVLRPNTLAWNEFAIWGAGRDGKEFFKYLSPSSQGKGKLNPQFLLCILL
jgi:glycosyltransferase involved in cell wall biosynthesis